MNMIKSKQIEKLIQAPIFLAGLALASGASLVALTAPLTAAAATAGDNGMSVPVQAATASAPGFIVTGNNIAQVWDAGTGAKLADVRGNEVYGRLTATYNLDLFTSVAGVETAYVAPSALTLNVQVNYLFTFATLPRDAVVGLDARYVSNDPRGGTAKAEVLAVTAVDTLAVLANAPDASREVTLNVNGQVLSSLTTPAPFAVAGVAVTWNAVNAGYSLETTDIVVAHYAV